jgi:hypothetical protein
MADNYLIPFGIDGTEFFKTMNEIDKGTEKMADIVTQATDEMQAGFDSATAAADGLGKKITLDTEKAAKLRDQAKTMGSELGAALSGKGVTGDYEKKLDKFADALAKLSGNASKPIKFNIDTAKLEAFEKALEEGADDVKILTQVVELAKEALKELDPNTEEWQALNGQIQIADAFLKELGDEADNVTKKNKSLKAELRELKSRMAELELAGKGNTDEFKQMAMRAGELEDQIGDVSARVKVFASDTKYIDAAVQAVEGLAGAFAFAQGALGLFGAENEEAEKVIQKVTSAMAILQGIQAVANALNKDSALSVLLLGRAQAGAAVSAGALAAGETAVAAGTTSATVAMRAFTASLLANPVTLVLIAITALVGALIAFTDGSEEAEKATKRLNDELERQKLLLELDEASLDRRTNLLKAQAKARGALESEITQIEGEALADRINRREEEYKEFVKLYNDRDLRVKLSAEDNAKLEDELLKRQQQRLDDLNDLEILRVEKGAALRKEEEDAKKKSDEAEKKRLEEAKKRNEEYRKMLEQRLQWTRELAAERIKAIVDDGERERAELRKQANDRIEDLQNQTALSEKAAQTRTKLIIQISENLAAELKKIDEKEAAERAALEFKAQQTQIDLMQEGFAKEAAQLKFQFDEQRRTINEEYKNNADLRKKLIAQVNAAELVAMLQAGEKVAQQTMKMEEERAILEVETAAKYLGDLPGLEEQKQIAVLEVKIKYAKLALQQLIDQGNAEDSVVVLQAKKAVQELEKALKGAVDTAKPEGIDWFKLLGIGDLSAEDRQAIADAAKTAMDSIMEVTDFIVDQYQRQIDKKAEAIQQTDDEIEDLEDRIDKEKDLRDEGLANNVDVLEAELAEKKKAREEEVKQAEELQKRQAALQKAQLILDTAAQASNLITASAKIFNSLASIPFVGVPLAIATIGLMTAAFVTAKVKAFQLVNDQKQSFGDGGWVDGKPHSSGGVKYVAVDGSGDVVELEGGEHVTRKDKAAKAGNLLDSINDGSLWNMNEDSLATMLGQMGIRLPDDVATDALNVSKERESLHRDLVVINAGRGNGQDVQEIKRDVRFMANQARNQVDRWEDKDYFYERKGNKTTRIRKT